MTTPLPASTTQLRKVVTLPTTWLVVFAAIICFLLITPLKLPIGGFYWDLDLYLNAAHRFTLGQYPHVDYFSQVGGLSLALFSAALALFPKGHPILLAQWSILIITLPLMWVLAREVQGRSKILATALVVPFVVFSFLPYNINEYFLSQAPDAFGIYNRQAGLVLYILLAHILWSHSPRIQIIVCSISLCALTLTKITGLIPALAFIGYGVLSQRLQTKALAISITSLLALGVVLELCFGMTSAFVNDAARLALLNTDSLVFRVVTTGARQFDALIVFTAILMICVLRGTYRTWDRSDRRGFLANSLASDAAWVLVSTSVAVIYESQNTGSNEFIYLWPLWVRIFVTGFRQSTLKAYVLGVLISMSSLPSIIAVVQRSVRAAVQSPGMVALPGSHLGVFGRVIVVKSLLDRARYMLAHYPSHLAAYRDLSEHGEMQSVDLFAKSDFQIFYLLSLENAVVAIRAYEEANRIKLTSFFTLDFVDPLSRLLDGRPPRLVSLAVDPRRTFPKVDDALLREIATIDAVIVPLCPALPDRDSIASALEPALRDRRLVQVSPCWQLLLRPGIEPGGKPS